MADHSGHRMRMMERLDEAPLYDHELLEMLLFNAVPRRNTNDLAHRLLAEFGSLHGVFSAKFSQLVKVEGIGPSVASYLCLFGKIQEKCYNVTEADSFPNVYEVEEFLSFAGRKYVKEGKEVLDVYFIESDGRIAACKRFSQKNMFRVFVCPEEFAQTLIEAQPSGIAVVHNHPFGGAVPSDKDDEMTKELQLICSMHNIMFCDHVIAAADGVYSYYRSGKLKEISEDYSVSSILNPRKEKKP